MIENRSKKFELLKGFLYAHLTKKYLLLKVLYRNDLQLDALREHGCEEIFTDKLSDVKDKRQGLEEALRFVRSCDALVVWRLDRLGRNTEELMTI